MEVEVRISAWPQNCHFVWRWMIPISSFHHPARQNNRLYSEGLGKQHGCTLPFFRTRTYFKHFCKCWAQWNVLFKRRVRKMCCYLMSEQGVKNLPVPVNLSSFSSRRLLLGCVSALLRQLIRLLVSHQAKDSRKPEIVSLDDSSS